MEVEDLTELWDDIELRERRCSNLRERREDDVERFGDSFLEESVVAESCIGNDTGKGDEGTGGKRFTKGGGRCFIFDFIRGLERVLNDIL